jgi:nitroreductase
MDVLEAIRTRRSVGKVKADPVPRHLIETMLEAAIWAPNHHRTEPWRFAVLTGEGRKALGRVLAEIASEGRPELTEEERKALWEREMAKAFRAPVIIVVAVVPSDHPKVVREEGHASIQNMLLASHALGFGAIWRTGPAAFHPRVKEWLGLGERDEILGFIYVGVPDQKDVPGRRTPFAEKTVWVEEEAVRVNLRG